MDKDGCLGAPELIIEIISTKKDVQQKFDLYQENEVLEYWIVQPGDKTVSVFDLVGNAFVLRKIYVEDDTVTSNVVTNFSLDLKLVFKC